MILLQDTNFNMTILVDICYGHFAKFAISKLAKSPAICNMAAKNGLFAKKIEIFFDFFYEISRGRLYLNNKTNIFNFFFIDEKGIFSLFKFISHVWS